MIDPIETYKRLTVAVCASLALGAAACGVDAPTTPPVQDPIPDPDDTPPPPPPAVFSTRVSRASTIAMSDDDGLVAMVNPDDGSLSVFQTSDNSRISKTPTGKNPSSVVIAGDKTTAYVANRDDGTIARVVEIDSGKPKADAAVKVGAEPVGLALAPSGRKLFVADFAGSQVVVVDTQTMTVSQTIKVDRPRAILVTNNADMSDDDEQLVVSQFYGVPVEGKEVKDDGRTGRIVTFPLSSLGTETAITLSPTTGLTGVTVTTSPNQLAAMAVSNGQLYITSVSASPQGPPVFNGNVYPVVYVADLTSHTELPDQIANLTTKVLALNLTPQIIPGDLSDIAFLDNSRIAYVVAKAGDVMLRLEYGEDLVIGAIGHPREIDLAGDPATIGTCQAPTGLVVSKNLRRAYVNCWVSRRLAVVEFDDQAMTQTVESTALPTDPAEASVRLGKRFYFTGRARWSNAGEGWSSCGSCHPDGLTDNITWAFGAGPRQTTSMDGSFSHSAGTGPQKQRLFNWTAVNDEMHDFELNVRGVSGGKGAITSGAMATGVCAAGAIAAETPIPLGPPPNAAVPAGPGPLTTSYKSIADGVTDAGCKRADWDNINNFVKSISPVHASKLADTAAIARGRTVFTDGQCANCHSGPGWTLSRRAYDPTAPGTDGIAGGGANVFGVQLFEHRSIAFPTIYDVNGTGNGQLRPQISPQPIILGGDGTGPAEPAVVPVPQVACVLRNVGTFGVPLVAAQVTIDLEKRVGTSAEGRAGYNIPSLYGLAVGAPYLHHGQAPTLEDLFSNPKWRIHTDAGNPNFHEELSGNSKLADLIAFLLSIDASTEEFPIPTGKDVCPGTPGQSL